MKKAGYELYYVGGCVRDEILKIPCGDIDFATNARPEKLMKIADDNGIKAKQVGRQFPVVLFHVDGVDYEIATYRKDGDYSNHRHPDTFEFADTIYEDLERRDFRMNALARCAYTKQLVDPFRGFADMANCVISTVGNPKARFDEDYLRILRFFRFVAKFDFKPDEAALAEISSNPGRVKEIVSERVYAELVKMFKTREPSIAFRLMHRTGVLKEILPEVDALYVVGQHHVKHFDDALTHTLNVLDYTAYLGGDYITQFAALFHDIGKLETAERVGSDKIGYHGHAQRGADLAIEIMTRLKFSNADKDDVSFLVHNHMSLHHFDDGSERNISKYLRRIVAKKGKEQAYRLLTLSFADRLDCFMGEMDLDRIQILDAVVARLELNPAKLNINGFDIMKILGIKGEKVGAVKDMLEDLVLEEKIPNDEEYLKFLLTYSAELVKKLAGVVTSK